MKNIRIQNYTYIVRFQNFVLTADISGGVISDIHLILEYNVPLHSIPAPRYITCCTLPTVIHTRSAHHSPWSKSTHLCSVNHVSLGHSRVPLFTYCLSCFCTMRAEEQWQRPYGFQGLKHLLYGPYKKKFADLWYKCKSLILNKEEFVP